jgi:hypothetical protein
MMKNEYAKIGIIAGIQTIVLLVFIVTMASSIGNFDQSELEVYPLLFVLWIIFFQGVSILWMMTKVFVNVLFLWRIMGRNRLDVSQSVLSKWHIIHLSYLLAYSVISVMYLSSELLRQLLNWSLFEYILWIIVVMSMFVMSALMYRKIQTNTARITR